MRIKPQASSIAGYIQRLRGCPYLRAVYALASSAWWSSVFTRSSRRFGSNKIFQHPLSRLDSVGRGSSILRSLHQSHHWHWHRGTARGGSELGPIVRVVPVLQEIWLSTSSSRISNYFLYHSFFQVHNAIERACQWARLNRCSCMRGGWPLA